MDEIERMDYLRNLRVELPVNPEWEALTQGEREALIEIATDVDSAVSKRFSEHPEALPPLIEKGLVNTSDDYWYYLTYKGAMIIPPHLVKKG